MPADLLRFVPKACLKWAGKRKDIATPLLLACRPHAFQRQRFCNDLSRPAHAATGIDAEQDWPAVGGRPDFAAFRIDDCRKLAPAVALVYLQRLLCELGVEKQLSRSNTPTPR